MTDLYKQAETPFDKAVDSAIARTNAAWLEQHPIAAEFPKRVRHLESGEAGTMYVAELVDGSLAVRTELDAGGQTGTTMTREVFRGLWDEWEVLADQKPLTGADLGFAPDHPFSDAEVISAYSVEQAEADGVFIKLGTTGRLRCTHGFADKVARRWVIKRDGNRVENMLHGGRMVRAVFDSENEALVGLLSIQPQSAAWAMKHGGYRIETENDPEYLSRAVSAVMGEYVAGNYCAPRRASSEPSGCDRELACYLFDLRTRSLASEAVDGPEVRIWVCDDGQGGATIMLPEEF